MKIIETNLKFRGAMANRAATRRIITHHAEASSCTPEQIHDWHLKNGWSGAGYHFLVRKNGSVYRLRPEGKVGSHAKGANSDSIGICFEGRYQTETMPESQVKAGQELVAYLKAKYGISKVQRHKDVCSTDCPGTNFPFERIAGVTASTGTVTSTPAKKPTTSTTKGDPWVGNLQAECNAQGFSNQAVDKIAGPITLAGCPTVRRGARGGITRLIQQRLNALGFNCGSADSIFGAKTEAAVKAFQRAHGLAADGIVGKNTWRKLLGL